MIVPLFASSSSEIVAAVTNGDDGFVAERRVGGRLSQTIRAAPLGSYSSIRFDCRKESVSCMALPVGPESSPNLLIGLSAGAGAQGRRWVRCETSVSGGVSAKQSDSPTVAIRKIASLTPATPGRSKWSSKATKSLGSFYGVGRPQKRMRTMALTPSGFGWAVSAKLPDLNLSNLENLPARISSETP
jgi:hypothetical protein